MLNTLCRPNIVSSNDKACGTCTVCSGLNGGCLLCEETGGEGWVFVRRCESSECFIHNVRSVSCHFMES
jgi:hypothetical protein